MIATTIPVSIDADAQQRIDQLGVQKEVAEMLDHAIQTIAGLQRIEVTFPLSYEHKDDIVSIDVFAPLDVEGILEVQRSFGQWLCDEFSPEVYVHFILSANPESCHESATLP